MAYAFDIPDEDNDIDDTASDDFIPDEENTTLAMIPLAGTCLFYTKLWSSSKYFEKVLRSDHKNFLLLYMLGKDIS